MKKIILTTAILILCAVCAMAQKSATQASAQGQQQTAARPAAKELTLASGTQLVAQLQTTLDAGKLQEGDAVIFKTTKDIKANGELLFKKGSTLIGHVTQAQKKSKETQESKIGLVFDRLENGSMMMPINATLTSVTRAATTAGAGDDLFAAGGSTTSSGSVATGSQSSGGLLGGVTGAVGGLTNPAGGVLNSTTQAAGGVVNSTTGTLGNTTGALDQTIKGLQISPSSNTSAEGSSMLSLTGANLKLEKGTFFNLTLNQEAQAEASPRNKKP
ncbi:MAG: hypothetical protein HY231_22935 [Acidobacteria bacterium]|nr:hypothetical protein [Acidobacteriota bacterium]